MQTGKKPLQVGMFLKWKCLFKSAQYLEMGWVFLEDTNS